LPQQRLLMQSAGQQSIEAIAEPGEQRQDKRALEVVLQQLVYDERQERHARQGQLVGRSEDLLNPERRCFGRIADRCRSLLHRLIVAVARRILQAGASVNGQRSRAPALLGRRFHNFCRIVADEPDGYCRDPLRGRLSRYFSERPVVLEVRFVEPLVGRSVMREMAVRLGVGEHIFGIFARQS